MLADIERDECRTCGQQVLGERDASGTFRCFHCLETARAPQGEQVRLFEPVAAPMPGQVRIVDIDDRLAEMRAQLEELER